MQKITPVFTEKSLRNAKEGKYTFRVEKNLNKYQIKQLVEENFEVKVESVKTMNEKDLEKTNFKGKKRKIKGKKKAIVSLKGDKKIDIFDNA